MRKIIYRIHLVHGSRSNDFLEKKLAKYLALTIYWKQRKNMTNQYIFFLKIKTKSKIDDSYFLLLSFSFVFMRPKTFELSK